jgi:hypothetical protein
MKLFKNKIKKDKETTEVVNNVITYPGLDDMIKERENQFIPLQQELEMLKSFNIRIENYNKWINEIDNNVLQYSSFYELNIKYWTKDSPNYALHLCGTDELGIEFQRKIINQIKEEYIRQRGEVIQQLDRYIKKIQIDKTK